MSSRLTEQDMDSNPAGDNPEAEYADAGEASKAESVPVTRDEDVADEGLDEATADSDAQLRKSCFSPAIL